MKPIRTANRGIPPLLATLAFTILIPAAAYGAVIDFQAVEVPGHALFPTGLSNPYFEDGFSIGAGGGEALSRWGILNPRYHGSTMLFNNTLPGTTTIAEATGKAFSIAFITLARVNNNFLANSETFDGTKTDNSQVSVTFSLPAGSPQSTITTFAFPASFVDLLSVSWSQDQSSNNIMQVDDIVVSAVPVPAALPLLASAMIGLFGLGYSGRKTA